jgi:non-ribosomal peptide synthetase component F
MSQGDTIFAAERGREFWRGALLAGGSTALPRWTLTPRTGVSEHDARIPDPLVTALRRLADRMSMPLSSVLLTVHAKVLGTLSGERDVSTGYVPLKGGPPLPIRISIGPRSWRDVLREARRAELELLSHRDFPVDDLRRELGLTAPLFETVFDRATDDALPLAEGTILWVGIVEHDGLALRLRYRTDALDAACVVRIAGYHLKALELIASDPDVEHERQSLLSADELLRTIEVTECRSRNHGCP